MSIELVMLCRPLPFSSSIFASISIFSNESALHIRWPKYWSFSFNISPSNEYSGLIFFRMDWLDLLKSKGHSRVFFNTTVQKHQFFGASCISPLVFAAWASLTLIVWVSIETGVVWGCTETGVVRTSTLAVWISLWVFTETKATLLVGGGRCSLASSLPSLEPRVQRQSRTGRSWRCHTQIYTLRT